MNYLFAYEAEMMMKDGLIREAIELCKKGLKEYPTYTVAYSVLANGYLMLNDYESAISTVEAALDRYPDNKSLLHLRNKLNDIFKTNNQYLIGETVLQNLELETNILPESGIYPKHKILSEEEVDKIYKEYSSENIILTNGKIEKYVINDFDAEVFDQINNFENLRDLIATFKDEESEELDYFTRIADKIGDGKIKAKPGITSTNEQDDEPYLVSETMAQIYEIQKAFTTAIKVYDKLCEKYPDKKEKFLEKIRELENKIN